VFRSNKDRQIAPDHLTVLQYSEAQGYTDVAHFCHEKVDVMGEGMPHRNPYAHLASPLVSNE
jgi:hypothetical protein